MAPSSKVDRKATTDVAAWMFNVVSSVGIIIVNKALMSTYGFSFATTLTGFHFAMTTLMTSVLRCLGYIQSSHLPLQELLKFVIFANFSIVGMNVSLMWNSVGFYQIAKLSMIPVPCFLEVTKYDTLEIQSYCIARCWCLVCYTCQCQYQRLHCCFYCSLEDFSSTICSFIVVGWPISGYWMTNKRVDAYDYNIVSW